MKLNKIKIALNTYPRKYSLNISPSILDAAASKQNPTTLFWYLFIDDGAFNMVKMPNKINIQLRPYPIVSAYVEDTLNNCPNVMDAIANKQHRLKYFCFLCKTIPLPYYYALVLLFLSHGNVLYKTNNINIR